MKLTNERLCTIATICYHLLFLGGASHYVTEFQKTRDTIVKQVDRLETELSHQASKIERQTMRLDKTGKSIESRLKSVERACSKLRF